jgi:thioredoxin-like negative regulator of GroEL
MIVELSFENFGQVTYREGIVLVDCWAPWCRDCSDLADVFRDAAERHPEHTFATLNAHDERELRASLQIQNVPSLMLFRDGVMLFSQPGSYDAELLDEIVEHAASLDMEQVRADLAATLEGSAA